MVGVSRRQMPALSLSMIPGYLFHGATAVLVLFFVFKALGA
jgi:hypothetical protein